jgi:hypothetical protein
MRTNASKHNELQQATCNLPLGMNRKEVKRKNRETEGLTNSLTKKEV